MSDRDEAGTGEKLKGAAKEAYGDVTGQEDKEREGEQQQKKAQKAEEARRAEDEADRKRSEASGHKGEEKSRRS
jgi:uncharacterized protein YjbJ (UPF0337 family)